MNNWERYQQERREMLERHAKPHRLYFCKDGKRAWLIGEFSTYDEAYRRAIRTNDGSLSWDNFEMEMIDNG